MREDTSLLHQVGPALFGPSWQTPLADALGVALRTVQRWAAGNPIPLSVWSDIADVCEKRGKALGDWSRYIRSLKGK